MDANPKHNDPDLPWQLILSALEGELSPEEDLQLRQWLASSPANQEMYDRLVSIYTEGVTDYATYSQADEDQAWKSLKMDIERSGREKLTIGAEPREKQPIPMRRFLAAAAVLLIVAGAGWWFFSGRGAAVSYETAAGEQRTVALPDGSRVALQPLTHIEIARGYNTTARTVVLYSGKARFDVFHRQQQPFTVEMDAASVQDIGTSFTIEKNPDSITVSVSGGKIAFTPKTTGQRREISAGGAICLYTTALHAGELRVKAPDSLRFINTPLSQVLIALEKQFGKKIMLRDVGTAQKPVTVRLDGESLESALQVICSMFDLQYKIKDGDYVLDKKKTSK